MIWLFSNLLPPWLRFGKFSPTVRTLCFLLVLVCFLFTLLFHKEQASNLFLLFHLSATRYYSGTSRLLDFTDKTSQQNVFQRERIPEQPLRSVVGVPARWWWGPSGNAQSVPSLSCCHHLSQYFTVLWTRPALELPVSLRSFFGNISRRFIYNLRAGSVPFGGRCAHTEYSMIQAYQLTDFRKSRNACAVIVCPWICVHSLHVSEDPEWTRCAFTEVFKSLTFRFRALSWPKH